MQSPIIRNSFREQKYNISPLGQGVRLLLRVGSGQNSSCHNSKFERGLLLYLPTRLIPVLYLQVGN